MPASGNNARPDKRLYKTSKRLTGKTQQEIREQAAARQKKSLATGYMPTGQFGVKERPMTAKERAAYTQATGKTAKPSAAVGSAKTSAASKTKGQVTPKPKAKATGAALRREVRARSKARADKK